MTSYRNSDPRPAIMEGTPPPPAMRVPLIDWDRPPWNRWTFQRVRQILPTAPIRRGATVSPLPEATGTLDALGYLRRDGTRTTFAEMLDATYTDAIWVWKGGRVLHESYHNGMDARSLHLLQSVSKSLTATAGANLIAEGLIDPAAAVTDYLPELAATAWNGATVQQVLDMTTGVRFVEDYEVRDSDIGKMDYASGWKPAPPGTDVSGWPQNMWDQITGLAVAEAPHGARFKYRSIETDVYAHLMERVTGQRLPQILSERLWQPLGCAEDADISLDPLGYGLACGGISASLRDLARFGLAYLNGGRVGDRQAIPASWVADVRHGTHGLFNEESRAEFPNGSYRNQFWIEDRALPRHYCLGVFGQMIFVAPDADMVAVKLSTWPDFTSSDLLLQTVDALHAIIAADP
ncbi:MAG: serine hydrolase [Defluviimonas sp.]|uniref:serine hydrolase domain-containing protein n=1 Tax=Albidovulum sp. TaxID=1872424 RepID=UPI001D9747A3|nr:serine hydrolase [Paracoccaceae bacterium]MCC0064488.1 serine hydrolase [Defluviimonas sp.]